MKTPENNLQGSSSDTVSRTGSTDAPARDDRDFASRAHALFRDAAERVDHVTAGQLRAARRSALDAAGSPQRHTARWLIPAGAFAAIALATLMVWQPLSPGPGLAAPEGAALQTAEVDNDLPPDAEKTDPNLYQNMDFYKWLAANNASAGAPASQPVNR